MQAEQLETTEMLNPNCSEHIRRLQGNAEEDHMTSAEGEEASWDSSNKEEYSRLDTTPSPLTHQPGTQTSRFWVSGLICHLTDSTCRSWSCFIIKLQSSILDMMTRKLESSSHEHIKLISDLHHVVIVLPLTAALWMTLSLCVSSSVVI